MIDWWEPFTSSIWILGLSIALATSAVARYEAWMTQVPLWDKLDEPGPRAVFYGGMSLVGLGFALSAEGTAERVIAAAFTGLFAGESLCALHGRHKPRH